jgi:uncharacterized repeat protein (TIGR01451 family)
VLTAVGSYTNEATDTGTPTGGTAITHTSNKVIVNVPSEPAFTIEKLQEIKGSSAGYTTSPLTGKIGQTVDYEVLVKNTGNVALTFSNFTDAHCDAGTVAGGPGTSPVAPGASSTYTCDHVLTAVGSYTNEATDTGTPPEGQGFPLTHSSNTVVVNVPSEPAFTIEKLQEIKGSSAGYTTSPLTGKIGQTVDYEVLVKNTGNVALTFSNFTDAHCDAGTIAGGPGTTPVEPGASSTYTCDHVLTAVGSYTNEATDTGTPTGGTAITHTSNKVIVNVPSEPAFTIEKLQEIAGSGGGFTASPLTGQVGQTVDYEIVVKNTGNIALTFSSFTDTQCDAGTIAGGPGTTPVEPGASSTYTCDHVLTTADQSAGSYANEATDTGTPTVGTPITHTSNKVLVNVPSEPAFTIEKLQEIAGSGGGFTASSLTGKVGQTVDYEIVVKNTGNAPLTFSSFTDAQCDAGTIIGGPGTAQLAPGVSTTYLCDHVLTAAAQSAGSYTNEATDTGTPTVGTPITHTSNKVLVNVPTPSTPSTSTSTSTSTPSAPASTPATTAPAKSQVLATQKKKKKKKKKKKRVHHTTAHKRPLFTG